MIYLQVIRTLTRRWREIAKTVVVKSVLDVGVSASVSRQCRYSSLFGDGSRACGWSNVIMAAWKFGLLPGRSMQWPEEFPEAVHLMG